MSGLNKRRSSATVQQRPRHWPASSWCSSPPPRRQHRRRRRSVHSWPGIGTDWTSCGRRLDWKMKKSCCWHSSYVRPTGNGPAAAVDNWESLGIDRAAGRVRRDRPYPWHCCRGCWRRRQTCSAGRSFHTRHWRSCGWAR